MTGPRGTSAITCCTSELDQKTIALEEGTNVSRQTQRRHILTNLNHIGHVGRAGQCFNEWRVGALRGEAGQPRGQGGIVRSDDTLTQVQMTRALVASDVLRHLHAGDSCRAGCAEYFPRRRNPCTRRLEQLPGLDGVAQVVAFFAIKPKPAVHRVEACTQAIASLG